ncbi:hypothetical protein JKG47_19410 [Acidithiobacillus sp. MC6.1]|nr:hypothetical protein [Acidithiobacillus sp. MC6.1]
MQIPVLLGPLRRGASLVREEDPQARSIQAPGLKGGSGSCRSNGLGIVAGTAPQGGQEQQG